jgi:predicted NUDIX family phosphoesterase
MNKMDEMIACIPKSYFKEYDFPGIIDIYNKKNIVSKLGLDCKFYRRGDVENNENLLQLIPYVYLFNSKYQLFAYARTVKGGEVRLFNKFSIGFGGHINNQNMDLGFRTGLVTREAKRELNEELKFSNNKMLQPYPVALLHIRETAVDRVHLGIIMALWVPADICISSNEDEIECVGWKDPKEILKYKDVEKWSQYVIQYFEDKKNLKLV